MSHPCPDHNAHLRLRAQTPSEEAMWMLSWYGEIKKKPSFMHFFFKKADLQGLDLKNYSIAHVTGLPDSVNSFEVIVNAVMKGKITCDDSNGIMILNIKQPSRSIQIGR